MAHLYTSSKAEKKANKQLKNCKKAVNEPKKGVETYSTAYSNSNNIEKTINTAQQIYRTEIMQKATSAKIENATTKAQERTRKETEVKNAI